MFDRYARILTVVLAAQTVVMYGISRQENVPPTTPLDRFPTEISGWRMTEQPTIDAEVLAVLRADDTLSRVYADPQTGRPVSLFIAFFKSQRTGQAPHSPKNCLPGSGWAPAESGTATIDVPGRPQPITVNQYLVAKGDKKSVVLYWYQSRDRVIASEYAAKMYLVADAIRYNRTDTALIRVVAPIGTDDKRSAALARQFVQAIFEPLREFLPS